MDKDATTEPVPVLRAQEPWTSSMLPSVHNPLPLYFPLHAKTLTEILIERAQRTPDRVAYHFLDASQPTDNQLCYSDLLEQACGLAALLQARDLGGERVLLVLKSNRHFVLSFYACLLAGAIAVPTALPRRHHLSERLHAVIRSAGIRAAIHDSGNDGTPFEVGPAGKALHWFDVSRLLEQDTLTRHAPDWTAPAQTADTLAFLQYTSGSTGTPKGVVISHGNLLANAGIIEEAFGHDAHSSALIALPLFHDMGLIGGIVHPMYSGFPAWLMPPASFIQKPALWLRALSEFRITTAGGPNFMYDLVERTVRADQIEGVDLSHWRVAFCGAEPVRAATLERFARRFAGHGFRAASLFPCYGMAESTLFITGNVLDRVPNIDPVSPAGSAHQVVSCGKPHGDTEVVIVDPATRKMLPAGTEGEVWVRGASVARGYWKQTAPSKKTFGARIANENSATDETYLRTGDLGYLRDGELYITGRLKDLIILRGRNIAPQDIENEAEQSHVGLRAGCGAAFAVTHADQERLILAMELKRDHLRRADAWPLIAAAVRHRVLLNLDLRIDDVVLMQTGALPKTSSGKVRRAQCAIAYRNGELPRIGQTPTQTPTQTPAQTPGQPPVIDIHGV